MPRIAPNLWFDTQSKEAAEFYCSIFPNSEIKQISYYTDAGPRPAGEVLTVDFVLDGHEYTAINGGPEFSFTEAISLYVDCADQREVDEYWDKLVTAGAQPTQCGWIKDPFGLSWQIIPRRFTELARDKDPKKVKAVMDAMMTMVKLDVAELERAYNEA